MQKRNRNAKEEKRYNQTLNPTAASTKIIALYIFFGFLWILFSDILLEASIEDHVLNSTVQTIKGILFVIITAIVFYYIIFHRLSLYAETIIDLKRTYNKLDDAHQGLIRLENDLYQLAYYDKLTGLPNIVQMESKISDFIKANQDGKKMMGLVYFDIDDFKHINEMKGHNVGDQLILRIANILSEIIKAPDMVARLGGDEFVIALFDQEDPKELLENIESCLHAIRKPFRFENDEFFVTYSSGITLFPDHGSSYITLMQNADTAMSIAKNKGKDQMVIFDDEMLQMTTKRIDLTNQLRQAIKNNEFSLHYQPILNLETKRLVAVEALIRWQHPVKGNIPPLDFIEIAEKTGIMKDINTWVFETSFKQNKTWQELGLDRLHISINVSAKSLMDANFVSDLRNMVDAYHVSCSDFELEITESAIIEDVESSIEVLQQLKNMGFLISLDDFGTGYSSLTYLRRLPIDIIKIDRSFINHIVNDPSELKVMKFIIELAHHLNLKVVAEGVETFEQAELVKMYHGDYAQGYYFSKPMAANYVKDYVKENA
ncbi:MAG: EAL domain-containing protein [Acholeplasmataceae bacterium]|nr:EAL domain-containing protein [Acholeplasmataceae bacterium]